MASRASKFHKQFLPMKLAKIGAEQKAVQII